MRGRARCCSRTAGERERERARKQRWEEAFGKWSRRRCPAAAVADARAHPGHERAPRVAAENKIRVRTSKGTTPARYGVTCGGVGRSVGIGGGGRPRHSAAWQTGGAADRWVNAASKPEEDAAPGAAGPTKQSRRPQ
jgi:hypothetical protein